MVLTEACCNTPPFESDYEPKGEFQTINGMDVYITGKQNEKVLFCIYDIFGKHNNTFQFCDHLASQGFKIIAPDFFLNNPYRVENLGDSSKVMSFINEQGDYDKTNNGLQIILNHFKIDPKHCGIFGFCWGSYICYRLCSDKNCLFKACGFVHPSLASQYDGAKMLTPVCNLISKDEPDMTGFMDSIKPDLKDKCFFEKFPDMHHGFCGARADYSNKNNAKRSIEANNHLAEFFKKTL